jgi:hypothetical protein
MIGLVEVDVSKWREETKSVTDGDKYTSQAQLSGTTIGRSAGLHGMDSATLRRARKVVTRVIHATPECDCFLCYT